MNRFELWDKVARNSQCRLPQHFRLVFALWFISTQPLLRPVQTVIIIRKKNQRESNLMSLSTHTKSFWNSSVRTAHINLHDNNILYKQ